MTEFDTAPDGATQDTVGTPDQTPAAEPPPPPETAVVAPADDDDAPPAAEPADPAAQLEYWRGEAKRAFTNRDKAKTAAKEHAAKLAELERWRDQFSDQYTRMEQAHGMGQNQLRQVYDEARRLKANHDALLARDQAYRVMYGELPEDQQQQAPPPQAPQYAPNDPNRPVTFGELQWRQEQQVMHEQVRAQTAALFADPRVAKFPEGMRRRVVGNIINEYRVLLGRPRPGETWPQTIERATQAVCADYETHFVPRATMTATVNQQNAQAAQAAANAAKIGAVATVANPGAGGGGKVAKHEESDDVIFDQLAEQLVAARAGGR